MVVATSSVWDERRNWSSASAGFFPAQSLPGPGVEGRCHGDQVVRAVRTEVGPLGEVLAQQPVGILVRATLPGALRIAEVDLKTRVDPQACVLRHLRS